MTKTSLLCLALLLSGCGMNRAVGVLPNTLDDLAAQRAGEPAAPPAQQPPVP